MENKRFELLASRHRTNMISRNLVRATLYVLLFVLEPSFGSKGPPPSTPDQGGP